MLSKQNEVFALYSFTEFRLKMRHFMHFIAVILTVCSHHTVFAQADSSVINQTRSYAKYIDSINKLDYVQDKGFMRSIADGIIKSNDAVVGGFGIYTLSNSKGDTAFRIECHDNLNINTYKTYYFLSDKLIYATLELQDGTDHMKSIYLREEFYDKDKIIWTTIRKDKTAEKYLDKTDFLLYPNGYHVLAEFKKQNNRH